MEGGTTEVGGPRLHTEGLGAGGHETLPHTVAPTPLGADGTETGDPGGRNPTPPYLSSTPTLPSHLPLKSQ